MCFWKRKKKQVEKVEEVKEVKETKVEKETVVPVTTKKKTTSVVIMPEEETKTKKGSKTSKVTPVKKTSSGAKQYIIQKSPINKPKWEVKLKGGSKALKLFDTEVEAREYANATAKNQKASTLKRASKGAKKGKFISSK